jgi:hypothetical protein
MSISITKIVLDRPSYVGIEMLAQEVIRYIFLPIHWHWPEQYPRKLEDIQGPTSVGGTSKGWVEPLT